MHNTNMLIWLLAFTISVYGIELNETVKNYNTKFFKFKNLIFLFSFKRNYKLMYKLMTNHSEPDALDQALKLGTSKHFNLEI